MDARYYVSLRIFNTSKLKRACLVLLECRNFAGFLHLRKNEG